MYKLMGKLDLEFEIKDFIYEYFHNFIWFFIVRYNRFKQGIKYFKFGYNAHTFDYNTIFETINFQLKDISSCIKDGYMEEKEKNRITKKINICCHLLNRITEDDYLELIPEYKEYRDNLGEMVFIKTKDKDGKDTNFSRLSFTNLEKMTEQEKVNNHKMVKRCYKKAQELKKQDMDLLFKILRHNIERFWD